MADDLSAERPGTMLLYLWERCLLQRLRHLQNRETYGIIVVRWMDDGAIHLETKDGVEVLRPGESGTSRSRHFVTR